MTTLTVRGAMNGQTSRTIGMIRGHGIETPLVIKRTASNGCVVPHMRDPETKKLVAISGRFRDDQDFDHLVSHLREHVISHGTTLTVDPMLAILA